MFSTFDNPTLKQLKGNRNRTEAAIESKLGKLLKSKLFAINELEMNSALELNNNVNE